MYIVEDTALTLCQKENNFNVWTGFRKYKIDNNDIYIFILKAVTSLKCKMGQLITTKEIVQNTTSFFVNRELIGGIAVLRY